jgi:predicted homoserine dehydrogenase-like protein
MTMPKADFMPLDLALAARYRDQRPVRVAVTGAGFLGSRIAAQVAVVQGMELAGIANRTVAKAQQAAAGAGYSEVVMAGSGEEADDALTRGRVVVCGDPGPLLAAEQVDVVIEATGELEYGAAVASAAIEHGKHVVVGAELDATVGPLLRWRAEQAGVVITGMDGDEPAVAMNLIRFVRMIGLQPVMAGNIKGFLNHHRNPETQQGFAEQWGQNPHKVASFADGTKLAAECTVLANASGFGVVQRGMAGLEMSDISEITSHLDPEELLQAPRIDYALGAAPGSGAFVIGYEADEGRRATMNYLKMGPGPLHLFTRPFHLPHLETPLSAARAALFGDAAVCAAGAAVCEAVAVAKRDLRAGEQLDGIGGFTWYAVVDNAAAARADNLLPLGLAIGATVAEDVDADTVLRFEDVVLPTGSLVGRLWNEQQAHFAALVA